MQVKEIDNDTGKNKGYGICKKKYKIKFLGGSTTLTLLYVGLESSADEWRVRGVATKCLLLSSPWLSGALVVMIPIGDLGE